MKLTLPYPPSANRYWRHTQGRIVRSREANDYKAQVGWLCNVEGLQPYTGNVSVSIDVYRPAKRGDLDNTMKCLLDALIGYAYLDDKQIVEIHAMRHDDRQDPRVEVVITEALS